MKCAIRLTNNICDIAVISDDGDFAFAGCFFLPESYAEFLPLLCQEISKADPSGHIHTIGVSLAANFSPASGQIDCPAFPLLHGQRLKADLQAALNRKILIANPAQMLANYAYRKREYANAHQIFSLYLDDEVLSGQLVHGKLLFGANGLAGNWGHIALPWPVDFELEARECACGRSGCLGAFVSRAALTQEYHLLTEKTASAEEIFSQAAKGDIIAESAVQIFEDRLARGLAMVINLCDPDIILLSGRMSHYDRLLVNIPRKWPGYIAGRIPETRLIAPFPSEEEVKKACLFGAAMLAE